jgi:hypothetical protein
MADRDIAYLIMFLCLYASVFLLITIYQYFLSALSLIRASRLLVFVSLSPQRGRIFSLSQTAHR